MLHIVQAPPEHKMGAVLKAAMKQGQWGYLSGQDANSQFYVTPVASSGVASYSSDRLFPIVWFPTEMGDIETYQTNDTAIPSGTRVICLIGAGNILEDDLLYWRHATNVFSGATTGALCGLSSSGYPYVTSGSQFSGIGQTPVAEFLEMRGTSIIYRTISSHSGVAS